MSKVEEGVMIMKGGYAWGVICEDGQSTSYGWIDPESAPIHNPKFCTKPTDVTYEGSYLTSQLEEGEVVSVIRTTTVEVK